ncbi:MAG: trypsin-like peptidase domain-containing protein [Defluviitaleaceae bacterium]|nr:trypsin-like peptidase domain-containing protein [Defluviitaleaceae bacterium]
MYEDASRKSEDSGPECFQPLYLPFVDMAQPADAEAEEDIDKIDDINNVVDKIEIKSTESASWTPSCCPVEGSRFYSETILSKKRSKDGDKSFFRPSRFALVVAVFFLFGGVLIGMGAAILVPSRVNNDPALSAQTAVDAAVAETPMSVEPTDEPAQHFTLETSRPGQHRNFNSDYIASALMVSNHIVELVAYIEPSVAAISTTGTVVDFFGSNPFRGPGERSLIGSGSGILFADDEDRVYIVTNAHVIENASSVEVRVMGSSPVTARLVGMDADEDLAIISIMKDDFEQAGLANWSLAQFGDSDEMQVGQMVMAIGNALGGGNTATNGVISAREQQIVVEGRQYTVLQTNAAINPGNSGGPLINMDGEVIGINTAKISTAFNVEGMGYSITSNAARPVIERFMNGISNRAFLGIEGRTIPREIAEMYGLPEMGVFVNSVFNSAPAQVAGIEPGDIITSLDGEPVMTMESLQNRIASRDVGDTVNLRIIRNGNEFLSISVILDRLIDTSF